MRDGELEVQTGRKSQTIRDDEVDGVLNSIRELTSQKWSEDEKTQESTKYVIKARVLEIGVEILGTMMKVEVVELVVLPFYRECIIRGVLSLLTVVPFLFISRSMFAFVIFFSIGKVNVDLDDITIVKKICTPKDSRQNTEFASERSHSISCSSIILRFSE